ncbi:MAG: hypothetical protein JSR37_06585 [Verrucomicrobia bacterium]|nr:hypothetical protein [Verrucomicrobiota bacterium]MBS0636476.1 hypothetical protein [Verrucomicrobiota bacterium]
MNVAPLPPQQDLLRVAPEDFLDTACERIPTIAKGALLLVAAAFTFYNGYSFYYNLSTKPTANSLALYAIGFTGGMLACCTIQSYVPSCCSRPNGAALPDV